MKKKEVEGDEVDGDRRAMRGRELGYIYFAAGKDYVVLSQSRRDHLPHVEVIANKVPVIMPQSVMSLSSPNSRYHPASGKPIQSGVR